MTRRKVLHNGRHLEIRVQCIDMWVLENGDLYPGLEFEEMIDLVLPSDAPAVEKVRAALDAAKWAVEG